jgi:hypothetical protein
MGRNLFKNPKRRYVMPKFFPSEVELVRNRNRTPNSEESNYRYLTEQLEQTKTQYRKEQESIMLRVEYLEKALESARGKIKLLNEWKCGHEEKEMKK